MFYVPKAGQEFPLIKKIFNIGYELQTSVELSVPLFGKLREDSLITVPGFGCVFVVSTLKNARKIYVLLTSFEEFCLKTVFTRNPYFTNTAHCAIFDL